MIFRTVSNFSWLVLEPHVTKPRWLRMYSDALQTAPLQISFLTCAQSRLTTHGPGYPGQSMQPVLTRSLTLPAPRCPYPSHAVAAPRRTRWHPEGSAPPPRSRSLSHHDLPPACLQKHPPPPPHLPVEQHRTSHAHFHPRQFRSHPLRFPAPHGLLLLPSAFLAGPRRQSRPRTSTRQHPTRRAAEAATPSAR